MGKDTALRDLAAEIAYDIAADDDFGVDISLVTGSTTLSLRGFILSGSESPSVMKDSEYLRISVEIPRQTGFPPSGGIQPGASMTINGIVYRVESVRNERTDSPTFILDGERYAEDEIAG